MSDANLSISQLAIVGGAVIGDVKYSYQPVSHSGWVILAGQAKSTLAANQQLAATSLGIGTNLPNGADRGLVGVSGTKALASTGGQATVTISQANLPAISLTGGSHGHGVSDSGHSHGMSPNYMFIYLGQL